MQKKSRRTIIRKLFRPAWFYFLSKALRPLSHNFGANRGEPIDRHYIEKFVSENSDLIQGVCLEIEDNRYTQKFGNNLERSDVADIDTNNARANLHLDLRSMPKISDNTYDCIILTQVFQFIDNYESAIKECCRILKTNGALLATLPFMSRIDGRAGPEGDYWRFTAASAKYAFGKSFSHLEIKSWGNVLSGLSFWIGQAQEELSKRELDYNDPNFPLIISVKAIK